jgi:DNA phosphorothioation-associated putative methyltransferase
LDNARKFRDGIITSRNTFQKYFTQNELKSLIKNTLDSDPIAIAPGIFWVFKDEIALQEFLIAKVSRRRVPSRNFERRPIRTAQLKLGSRFDEVRPALEHLSSDLMHLGRLLHENEVSEDLRDAFNAHNISLAAAQNFCLQNLCDHQQMADVANERRDDLLLYFASEIFRRHKPYRKLPLRLQQDIKFYWGSYLNAQEDARNLLFSVGDEVKIRDAAHIAVDSGHGFLLPGSKLQFHRSALGKVSCARGPQSLCISQVQHCTSYAAHIVGKNNPRVLNPLSIVNNLPLEPDWVERFYKQRGTVLKNTVAGQERGGFAAEFAQFQQPARPQTPLRAENACSAGTIRRS